MQCTAHTDCCSSSCLSFSYKCVERHGHQYDTQPATMNNIDELVDRFGGSDVPTTNTYQTYSTDMPSTSFPVQTDQPTTLTINETGSSESICRSNGNLVQYSIFFLITDYLKRTKKCTKQILNFTV